MHNRNREQVAGFVREDYGSHTFVKIAAVLTLFAIVAIAAIVIGRFFIFGSAEVSVTLASAPMLDETDSFVTVIIHPEDETEYPYEHGRSIRFDNEGTQKIKLEPGQYTLEMSTSMPLLADGTSSYLLPSPQGFYVAPGANNIQSIEIELEAVDISTREAIDEALNRTDGNRQEQMEERYLLLAESIEAQRREDIVEKDTENYLVTVSGIMPTNHDTTAISGTITNKCDYTFQYAEVNIKLKDTNGVTLSEAKWYTDTVYSGETIEFEAEGYVNADKVASYEIGEVIWY